MVDEEKDKNIEAETAPPVEETPEAPVEETPAAEETPAEELPPVEEKPKHRQHDRLSKAYPDRKFESDEDYDNALEEYLGGMESENGELKEYRERGQKANQRLIAMFEAEPAVGGLVKDVMNGATVREALARHFSPEDLIPQEGDPDYEGWNKNKIAREESASKRRKSEEEYTSNLELSAQAVQEFASEKGMDETAIGEFLGNMDVDVSDLMSGKITKQILNRMHKAYTAETEIASAREQGEISGRNQNIVATKENAPAGDGLPKIASSSEIPTEQPKPDYIDQLVNRTKSKQRF